MKVIDGKKILEDADNVLVFKQVTHNNPYFQNSNLFDICTFGEFKKKFKTYYEYSEEDYLSGYGCKIEYSCKPLNKDTCYLEFFRKLMNCTQKQLAEATETTVIYISNIENGKRNGTVKFWKKVQKCLNVPDEKMWLLIKNDYFKKIEETD